MNQSHGHGSMYPPESFKGLGPDCILERTVLVFHPETITLGVNVYVGHYTILKGYWQGAGMHIGDGCWIGQQCFLHSAGGIILGKNVGVGPGVKMLTSVHREVGRNVPILHSPLRFAPITVDDDADIGINAVIMPGIHIGKGALIGAGAVVTHDVPAYAVVAGVPAKVIRYREDVEFKIHTKEADEPPAVTPGYKAAAREEGYTPAPDTDLLNGIPD